MNQLNDESSSEALQASPGSWPSSPASSVEEPESDRILWDDGLWSHFEPYKYTSLGSGQAIRLLEVMIKPSHREQPIMCRIVEVELKGAERGFDALSYAWEGQLPTKQLIVICDADEVNPPHARLAITQNVEDALRRLQDFYAASTDETCFLIWIDAVCINQENSQERGSQVSMMASIYESVENVVIWLGRGNARSDHVMSTLLLWQDMSESLEKDRKLRQWFWDRFVAEVLDFTDGFTPEIAARPYWTRIWTLQEVARGRVPIVLCGDAQPVQIATIADVIVCAGAEYDMKASAILTHVMFYALHKGSSVAMTRLDHIMMAQRKLASNPLDKIFALRSLGIEALDRVAVDYTKSAAHVYHLATRSIIENHGSCSIWEANNFVCCGSTPTWTVDFEKSEWLNYQAAFREHEEVDTEIKFNDGAGLITAQGREIGEAGHCFAPIRRILNPFANVIAECRKGPYDQSSFSVEKHLRTGRLDGHFRIFRAINVQLLSLLSAKLESLIEVWQSLLCALTWGKHEDLVTAWLHAVLPGLDTGEKYDAHVLRQDLSQNEALEAITCGLFGAMEDQTLFVIVERKLLGFTATEMKQGDRLVLFAGLTRPIVLHRCESGSGNWKLRGAAVFGRSEFTEEGIWEVPLEDFTIA